MPLRLLILLLVSALFCSGANNCAWFVGRLHCSDATKLENIVVEIWDKDRSFVSLAIFVKLEI